MKVIEQWVDVQTGEGGRREVEMSDIVTAEEATRLGAIRAAERTKTDRIAAIRGKLVDLLAEAEAGDSAAKVQLITLTEELRALKAR